MISAIQYDEHYKLYIGYANRFEELNKKKESSRQWLKDFNYNYAGKILHELYFNHIDNRPSPPNGQLMTDLARQFGSFSEWKNNFAKSSTACRPAGWSFLVFNEFDRRLYNIIADSHDQFLYGMHPLITLDMYEHAYMIDYGVDKQSYIKDFIENLNWQEINDVYRIRLAA